MTRIGIIGCGTLGSHVAKALEKKFSRVARLSYVSDVNPVQVERLWHMLRKSRPRFVSFQTLISKSDFIIETASVGAAAEAIPCALRLGKRIMVMSVGGVLFVKDLPALLHRTRGALYIPTGAIAGIDGVLASKMGRLRQVRITTRKPLAGLKNSPFFKKKRLSSKSIRKPTLIFEGNVRQAIRNFPENVNVAATLSLAGLGPARTRVRVFTSPTYRFNSHEIEVIGDFGEMTTRVSNRPSRENPKTSMRAIGSAVATLEKIFQPFKIGT